MDRLGQSRTPEDENGLGGARARVGRWITQLIAASLALAMFVVMAYLVYVEQIPGDALTLFAGLILGYLLHAVQDVF